MSKWILLEPGVDTIQAGDERYTDGAWHKWSKHSIGFVLESDVPCRRRAVVEPVCKREAFSGGGSPSPRECGICGVGPCSKPAETPDDWVTQDRVGARPGIDERRFTTIVTGYAEGWGEVKESWSAGLMHGGIKCGQSVELRCRRKDLPVKPKTRTVTLKEYVVWDTEGCEYVFETSGEPNASMVQNWEKSHATGNTRTVEVPSE